MATASSFAAVFISSAIASCFAEVCTIPLDTAKVRLQLQKKTAAGPTPTGGMLGTMRSIAREEGVTALWKGIVPGLHRQCLYGGLRVGLYEPVKALFVFVGEATLLNKILAALTTGVIAISVANPTDLVKVRLQADGKSTSVKRQYSGALNAYATIIRQEGIGALWTGLGPNMARNALINAAELASYDQFKQLFLSLPGFTDNVYTHLLAGLGAGIFAVCIGSPVDVVKSRMMGDSSYRSTIDCFAKTLKNDLGTDTYISYFGFSLDLLRALLNLELRNRVKEGLSSTGTYAATCDSANHTSLALLVVNLVFGCWRYSFFFSRIRMLEILVLEELDVYSTII